MGMVYDLLTEFQSTLPVGGATPAQTVRKIRTADFNPRSPWGERPAWVSSVGSFRPISIHAPRGGSDLGWSTLPELRRISIHAPRGGSDSSCLAHCSFISVFQSTLPVGGATAIELEGFHDPVISIHAPRGGSDPRLPRIPTRQSISIHAPRGGSDNGFYRRCFRTGISIHAPRGGSDVPYLSFCHLRRNFNPRSPWGERP